MSLLAIVKNLGLVEKEARVYLACLELGSTVVAEIAKRAAINRVTAYDILEKLVKKGMVNYVKKNGKIFYDATDPHVVSADFRQRARDFRKSLPEFDRLRGEAVHPRIHYYEGLEGIKALYQDTLNSTTEILNFSNSREIRTQWPEYDSEYVAKRVKKGIFLRGIAPQDEQGEWVQVNDAEMLREFRLVPADQFTFKNEINIYDDKVAIISYSDVPLIGMVIESQEIANTQRDIFKMAWEFAGRF